MVDDKILLDAGYVRFEKNKMFDSEGVECKYQKRFDDENGTKYFITVDKWKPYAHPYTGKQIIGGYEFFIQLSDKETDAPVNIQLFSGWDLDAAEKRAEDFWNMGVWRYYEEFEHSRTEER